MPKYGQKLTVDVTNDSFLAEVDFSVRSPEGDVFVLSLRLGRRARELRKASGSMDGAALQRTDVAAASSGRGAVTCAAVVGAATPAVNGAAADAVATTIV